MTDDSEPILFTLSEVEDERPFYELEAFVRELAPNYLPTLTSVLRGETVDRRDIQKIISFFVDTLVPFYNTKLDGGIADPKMARLDEAIYHVGRQL